MGEAEFKQEMDEGMTEDEGMYTRPQAISSVAGPRPRGRPPSGAIKRLVAGLGLETEMSVLAVCRLSCLTWRFPWRLYLEIPLGDSTRIAPPSWEQSLSAPCEGFQTMGGGGQHRIHNLAALSEHSTASTSRSPPREGLQRGI